MKLKKLKKKCVSEYFVQNPSAHQTPEQIGMDKFLNIINMCFFMLESYIVFSHKMRVKHWNSPLPP